MTKTSVLVTGGSGFIGRNLTAELLNQGYEVSMLLRHSSILPETIETKIIRINCDDWTREGLHSALSDCQFSTVLHLASYGVNPSHRNAIVMSDININLPVRLLELSSKWKANMIMLGSCSEYSAVTFESSINELSQLESSKLYGASKAAGTLYACAAAEYYNVHLRVLRLFNVYGPDEASHRLLPSLMHRLCSGERVSLSEGKQKRDFIYISDAIDAVLQVLKQSYSESFARFADISNVCTGKPHSVKEFAETVADQLGVSRSLLGFGDLEMRPDDLPWVVGNPEKFFNDIGWKASYTLESGIADIVLKWNKD